MPAAQSRLSYLDPIATQPWLPQPADVTDLSVSSNEQALRTLPSTLAEQRLVDAIIRERHHIQNAKAGAECKSWPLIWHSLPRHAEAFYAMGMLVQESVYTVGKVLIN